MLHTPGHSEGCVCYLIRDKLFSGDTLFADSVGRTDTPGGSNEALQRSLKEKIATLPEKTEVYTGHEDITTIGEEKHSNSFLQ